MSTARPARTPSPHPPSIFVGALLRLCWQECRERILAALRARGFDDLTQVHLGIFGWPMPDGVRPIDLAERTYMTKQALNYVVAQLESRGYLERRGTGAASRRLIYMTPRGWQVAETMRATMQELEVEWGARVGRRKFAEFLKLLRTFAGVDRAA
jgi:DNA-binding MarR family transcriptional regulator